MGWSFMEKPAGMSAAEFIKADCFAHPAEEVVAIEEKAGAVFVACKIDPCEVCFGAAYAPEAGEPIVAGFVFLIEDKGPGRYGFGYKSMSELEGPYHPGAPSLEFLGKLSPLKKGMSGWAAAWRERMVAASMAKMEG